MIASQNWGETEEDYQIEFMEDDDEALTALTEMDTNLPPQNREIKQKDVIVPVKPMSSDSINTPVKPKITSKRTSAAMRYDRSITQTEKLARISELDYEERKSYHHEKLKILRRHLDLMERDVVAKETLCSLLANKFKET